MESFEELGLEPELVEALSSDGLEGPTPFQTDAIPVIRRGNNLLGRAGPGAGTLVAYGAALLDRLDPGGGSPRALVLAPTTDSARRLAESLAGLAAATGHVVAAAGIPWVLPERADLLFGSPADLLAWARASRFDVHAVEALVVDQASALQHAGGLADVEALLEFLPREAQRVVLALPVTPEIEDFVERHARRAVQLPPQAVEGATGDAGPRRGEVRYRIVEEPREVGALQLVSELLEGMRHCCLFFATEDRAADVGDYLTLHGYAAGAPGDDAAPVWLAVRELAARTALKGEGVVPVSFDVPSGPDSLDRRHGGGRGGTIIVLPREMPHLRDVARRTGYRVVPFPPPAVVTGRGELDALLARLEAASGDADLGPYLIALEPLFERKGAAEVAAAAVALLRQRTPAQTGPAGPSAAEPVPARMPQATAPASRRSAAGASAPPAAYVRLYISLGERDNVGPGDVVGAITGESGIASSRVGKVEIRESFSIVEVQEPVAEQVIRALNGITVRGRSVRADYDRPRARGRAGHGHEGQREPRGPAQRGPRGGGRAAPRRGAPRRGGDAPRKGGPRGEGRGAGKGPTRGDRSAPRSAGGPPRGDKRGGRSDGGATGKPSGKRRPPKRDEPRE